MLMKTYIYTVITDQTSTTVRSTSTDNISLTGTNNVTFALSGIDQEYSNYNKVVVDLPSGKQRSFTRTLTGDYDSLSAVTFEEIVESEVQDICEKYFVFYLYRDDGFVDQLTTNIMSKPTNLTDYTDVNLIKSEYIATENSENNLVLTFNADDPNITGVNIIDIDSIDNDIVNRYYKTNSTNVSSQSASIDLHTGTIITNATRSHLKGIAYREGYNGNQVTVKYRTLVPTVTTELKVSSSRSVIYSPAIPNTTFFHTSGELVWHANERAQVKTFTIPLIDTLGAFISSTDDSYFDNFYDGNPGATDLRDLSGNYFFVELYDLSGCDVELCDCATLTAYINY